MPETKKVDEHGNPIPDPEKQDGGEKLIAGKYKTIEEAEKAIQESQRRMHEATESEAKWRRMAQETLEQGRGSDTDDEDSDEFTESFLRNPKKGLTEFGNKLANSVLTTVTSVLDKRDMVKKFLDKNPETSVNPRLFMAHVAQTDPNESDYTKRLSSALDSYKTDLEDIEKRGREKKNAADDFEDKQKKKAASSPKEDGDEPVRKRKQTEDEESGSYSEYIKEREAQRAKILSPQI